MPALANDPTTQLAFSMFENKGVYAVLLGSGVSRSAGIPTGWEITMELVKRAGIASGAGEQDDWHAWYVGQTGQQPNYSTLLETLAGTQSERRSIVQGFLEPNPQELEDGLKVPTRAHRAIAEMVKAGHVRVIVTTNFDRLMENALRDVGVEPTIISSVDTLAGAEPLTHSQCFILKIHGDYKDARILNTDEELGGYPPEYDALLDRIIDEFGLIVAGWSGEWDHALRSAFVRAPSRRYPTYWLSRGNLSERGRELVTQRRATIVSGSDADSFFDALNLKLETITQSRLPNPSSVELTISMAKRFMARPEHRIQLDDLITAQARQTIADFVPEFAGGTEVRNGDFGTWVSVYESTVEPLAHLATVLGRWGTGPEISLILDAVKSLYAAALKEQSGYVHWLSVKNYPAALVMYGYALGLTRANRLDDLYRVLSTSLINRRELPGSIGVELSPFYMESGNGLLSHWKTLEGQDTAKTPFSNWLTSVVTPRWAPTFAGVHDPELLYERFEFLSLLYFVEKRDVTEAVLNELIEEGKFRSIAMGRLSWHSETINRFAHEYSTPEYAQPLLAAGFAFGSESYLQGFLDGLKRLSRW
ncbi:SIR2 family protein [Pseudomonas salomonii]|uniref:SIR2 family protein n=1 Tax=Pseudomonas salomonii TaxID=191391 RepID=A0A7Y8GB30_9PSED|nr:SIR2 family protein [Pseudomonas salomonii]NWF06708.1 SIR2 family protein [Pseudomonas salomonii]